MADGFLGRWAKRKEAVRQGQAVPAEPVPAPGQASLHRPPTPAGAAAGTLPAAGGGPSPDARSAGAGPAPAPGAAGGGCEGQPRTSPPPTLEDVQSLTPASDFRRFVQRDVAPDVRNAAMKKLWADPHFNVMDGLDIYIGDYNKPDPLPPEMLRQLASARFLNLFEEEKEEEAGGDAAKAPTPREAADAPGDETVAQSSTRTEQALPPAEDHADPDLRLQQDDAPGPESPGAGSR